MNCYSKIDVGKLILTNKTKIEIAYYEERLMETDKLQEYFPWNLFRNSSIGKFLVINIAEFVFCILYPTKCSGKVYMLVYPNKPLFPHVNMTQFQSINSFGSSNW